MRYRISGMTCFFTVFILHLKNLIFQVETEKLFTMQTPLGTPLVLPLIEVPEAAGAPFLLQKCQREEGQAGYWDTVLCCCIIESLGFVCLEGPGQYGT